MKCIIALAGLILLGLSLYALRYSYLFPVEYLEIATPQKDSVWKTVVGAAALFFLLLLVSYGIRQVNYRKQKLLQALLALMFVLAAFLFIQDGTVYQAGSDPWYICDSAAKFIEGDYSPLQAGGYLDQYPYQLGLTLYTELVFRLTGVWNVKALVFANLLAMTAGLVFGQLFLKKTACYPAEQQLFCLLSVVSADLSVFALFIRRSSGNLLYLCLFMAACSLSG